MHTVFFGLKRAHHATLALTREALKRMGLTAARFDLLFALKDSRLGMLQSRLRRLLGVSRTTVSRMLASLEQLGLLTRKRSWSDRRTRDVNLTPRGRATITLAHRRFTRSGWAQLAVDSALGTDGAYRWYREGDSIQATALFDGLLRQIRRVFPDRATLVYPWEPDSVGPWDLWDVEFGDFEFAGSASGPAETESP
ncbi:MAG TPA: MarR family transcriptional regulator [Polyangiaceae bacterium]|jgi:DNA-binding MarR family transcriptional regulator|nr:MarR family transcriptional regulator [Polyangiaceae bacterium]